MTVKMAVEKQIKSYKNANVEVDQRTGNNRLIFLLENVFHASHVIKTLEEFDLADFTSNYILKSPLFNHVLSVRAFLGGNYTPEDTESLVCMVLKTLNI